MRRPPRIVVLIGALAALAVWVAWDEDGARRASVSGGEPQSAAANRERSATATLVPEISARATLEEMRADPFSPHSWEPPAVPVVAPVRAASAPPLPFRFAGRFYQDGVMQVLFGKGDAVLVAKQGDTLDGRYRVEAVSDAELTLVYLPMGTKYRMQFDPLLPEVERAAAAAPQANVPTVAIASQQQTAGPAPAAELPAQLRWEGPASARLGSSFNVVLRVTSGERIRSAPMQLQFDPRVLESVAVRAGRDFGGEATGGVGYRVNPDGSIYVGVSSQAAAPAADAEVLVLTFKPISTEGATEVAVASLTLQGVGGTEVEHLALSPFRVTITR